MAAIDKIQFRKYGSADTHFNYLRANAPLEDLYRMVTLVNNDLENVGKAIKDAQGSKVSLKDRLSTSLENDGTIKVVALPDYPIGRITPETTGTDTDKVIMLRSEKSKLEGISARANRFSLRVGSSDSIDGNVKIDTGSALQVSLIRNEDGDSILKFDTRFSPEALHVHRYGVPVSLYLNGVAFIPDDEPAPIPDSIVLWVNGQRLRHSAYEEFYDGGYLRGVRILEQPEAISLQYDDLELDFLAYSSGVAVSAQSSSNGETTSLLFDHDAISSDYLAVPLPEASAIQTSFYYWLFDISDLDSRDWSQTKLFVSEEPFSASANTKGLSLRRYGQEWDVVSLGGAQYIRWRYQEDTNLSTDSGVEDKYANYLFLTQTGAGSSRSPNAKKALSDLAAGFRIMLFI